MYGAQETLLRHTPILFVEIHSDALLAQILVLMRRLGYQDYEFVHTVYEDDDKQPACTYGYLFWKEGRITWLSAH